MEETDFEKKKTMPESRQFYSREDNNIESITEEFRGQSERMLEEVKSDVTDMVSKDLDRVTYSLKQKGVCVAATKCKHKLGRVVESTAKIVYRKINRLK